MKENTVDINKFIKPLSQIDLANGWQLIVPHKINITKNSIDNKGNNIIKVTSNIVHSRINLAQLPRHLLSQYKSQHSRDYIKIIDRCHYYYIEPTSIDQEIIQLIEILDNPYKQEYKGDVNRLLNILKENDITGWCVIRANMICFAQGLYS